MPENDDKVIKGLAEALGMSEADAAKLQAAVRAQLLKEYAEIKAGDPTVGGLEQKEHARIVRYAQAFGVSEEEAAAGVILPILKARRERQKPKPKMTEAELKELIGTDDPIPQDVLDMLDGD